MKALWSRTIGILYRKLTMNKLDRGRLAVGADMRVRPFSFRGAPELSGFAMTG
jgi:hypothetical protein